MRFVRRGFIAAVIGSLLAACSTSGPDAPTVDALEVGAPAIVAGPAEPVAAPERVFVFPGEAAPGIDVSHYQGTIDWTRVAASGVRFVFAKATEGRSYLDRTYLGNKEEAEANGLLFGAYHFANPDHGRIDAIREANHFVDEARLGPGNLLPVLDLETTGGLNHRQLTRWILAWLRQVERRLGVKSIVYTSPVGWDVRVGDTDAIARAGYEHLWVAHWGVEAPLIPADRWGGHGWTFWQRSACGSVPGIEGCVDLDVAGRSLEVATIPTGFDTVIPTAGVTAPTGTEEPIVVTFDEPVVGISGSTVRLRAFDDAERLRVRLTCPTDYGVPISCETTGVQTVQIEPTRPIVPGERYRISLAEQITDLSGNPLVRTSGEVDAPTELEQGSAAITYAWASVPRDNALGGSYVVEERPGANATFAFWGSSVTWFTSKGPEMGRAAIAIDGRPYGEIDLSAASPSFGVEVPLRDLGPGEHTVTIEVLGRGERHPGDAPVVIDAFRTEHGLVEDPDLVTGWAVRRDGADRHAAASLEGASAEVTFAGTGLVWHTIVGPEHGHAAVVVDGVFHEMVDTHAPARGRERVRITGLDEGEHTVRIVVLEPSDAPSSGGGVSIDAFSVIG